MRKTNNKKLFDAPRRIMSKEIRRRVLFADVEGHAVPAMAMPDGKVREDNALTIEQASERFGLPIRVLREMWVTAFRNFIQFEDDEAIRKQYPSEPAPAFGLVRDGGYEPHLASWHLSGYTDPPKGTPRGFAIYEDPTGTGPLSNGESRKGEWLCTIVVNPAIGPKDARSIADFMSYAPQIWRAARHGAEWLCNDRDQLKVFSQVVNVLFASAGHWPFVYPQVDEREEANTKEIMKKNSLTRMGVSNG
jgi:hypothetical protein